MIQLERQEHEQMKREIGVGIREIMVGQIIVFTLDVLFISEARRETRFIHVLTGLL